MENLHFPDEPSLPRMQDLSLQMKQSPAAAPSSKAPPSGHGTPQESEADVITCCPVCGKQANVDRFGSITLCKACHNFARTQVERPMVLDCLSGYENTENVKPCTLRANRQMCKVCNRERRDNGRGRISSCRILRLRCVLRHTGGKDGGSNGPRNSQNLPITNTSAATSCIRPQCQPDPRILFLRRKSDGKFFRRTGFEYLFHCLDENCQLRPQ